MRYAAYSREPHRRVRNTRQRDAVARVIHQSDRPLTASEVLELGRHEIVGLGIATVYRTLANMAAEGTIETVQIPNDPPRYERRIDREHHYFCCRECGRAFWVFGSTPEIDRMTPRNFTVNGHAIYLYGRCVECRTSERS